LSRRAISGRGFHLFKGLRRHFLPTGARSDSMKAALNFSCTLWRFPSPQYIR
jgi:hypothetical protein